VSTPSNGAPYDQRVMVEVMTNGIPRRVHVWTKDGETLVSFPDNMTEAEATLLVARGLDLLRPLDVAALFRPGISLDSPSFPKANRPKVGSLPAYGKRPDEERNPPTYVCGGGGKQEAVVSFPGSGKSEKGTLISSSQERPEISSSITTPDVLLEVWKGNGMVLVRRSECEVGLWGTSS